MQNSFLLLCRSDSITGIGKNKYCRRVAISSITEDEEDYSQYIPRGYYEGDEQLESYFKAMMWYGRIHFRQDKEELDKSALLITMALAEDAESYKLWKAFMP